MERNELRQLLDGNRKWWADYFAWGFAVAVLLRLASYGRGQTYCIVTVLVFMTITGLRENIEILIRFLKRHYVFTAAWILAIIYFEMHQPEQYQVAARQFIRSLALIFAGYRLALCGRDTLTESIKKAEVLAVVSMLLGLWWHFSGRNGIEPLFSNTYYYGYYFTEQGRLMGLQVHPLVEAAVYVAFMILAIGVIENRVLRAGILMLGTVCLFLTGTRMATIVFFAGIIAYLIASKEYERIADTVKKNRKIMVIASAAVLIALLGAAKAGMFSIATERFGNIMDEGNTYRLDAWTELCRIFFDRPVTEVIGGSGLDGAAEALADDEWLISRYGDYAGVVDNMYLSVAYNYGLVAITAMIYITVSAMISFVKAEDRLERTIALAMLCFLAQSVTSDFQGWINILFIFLTLCGIHLAIKEAPLQDQFFSKEIPYHNDQSSQRFIDHVHRNGE